MERATPVALMIMIAPLEWRAPRRTFDSSGSVRSQHSMQIQYRRRVAELREQGMDLRPVMGLVIEEMWQDHRPGILGVEPPSNRAIQMRSPNRRWFSVPCTLPKNAPRSRRYSAPESPAQTSYSVSLASRL